MTEREWLESLEPAAMLRHVWRNASNRKLRLLTCAWCRRHWHTLPDQSCRDAVEVGERYADGQATADECLAAREPLLELKEAAVEQWDFEEGARVRDIEAAVTIGKDQVTLWTRYGIRGLKSKAALRLIREIFNPFHQMPSGGAWRTPVVLALAETIYAERSFDLLPRLADALERAGCKDEALLRHFRDVDLGPHVRGCWALDLILDKS